MRLEVAGCVLEADVTGGTGGPIVFLHGASSSRADARRILDLAGTDRPLLMPDSRGHGDSSEGAVAGQSWQQLIDDAVAWLDHIDARDAVVAGVSMGRDHRARCRARPTRPGELARPCERDGQTCLGAGQPFGGSSRDHRGYRRQRRSGMGRGPDHGCGQSEHRGR